MVPPTTMRAFIAALILASCQVSDARIRGPAHNQNESSLQHVQGLPQQQTPSAHNQIVESGSDARGHDPQPQHQSQKRRQRRHRRQQEQIGVVRQQNDHVDILRETDGSGAPSSYSTHIVGGTRASSDRYPYFVSVYTKLNGGSYHVCGATLIESDVVLCAAHCADHADFVRVGAYQHPNSRTNGGEPYHDSRVASRHVHPNFFSDSRDRLHNDAMLLKLAKPVTDSELLQNRMKLDRVKRVDQNFEDGDPVTAIGLGRVNEKGSVSKFLKEVDLKYMSNDKCSLYFGDLPDEMMCAKEANVDACEGDSGGALIKTGNDPRSDVQIGIISWGSGCANSFPGVYTRVAEIKDWIDLTICEISPSNCPNQDERDDAVRATTFAAQSPNRSGKCEDVDKYCGESILPKNVFCFINGNVCPATCGRCQDDD
mmetsp:Transcript_114/g.304  ORF Transcript_114/g.304 Transcript_114/m.304 type:complete len:427 (+) Transcript_114:179-1459(+)